MKLLKGLIEIPAALAAGIDIYEYFLKRLDKYNDNVFQEIMLAFTFIMRKNADQEYHVDLRNREGEGVCTCWPYKNKTKCKHLQFLAGMFYNDQANMMFMRSLMKLKSVRQVFRKNGVDAQYEIRPVERTERLWVPDGYDVQDGISEDSKVRAD